jgi:hypothetical protein
VDRITWLEIDLSDLINSSNAIFGLDTGTLHQDPNSDKMPFANSTHGINLPNIIVAKASPKRQVRLQKYSPANDSSM